MNYIIDTIKFKPKLSCLFSGLLSGLIFAPIFMFPCVFALGILAYHTWTAETPKKAFAYGFWFGIGHFLVGLYWVTFAIFVYIDDFWWAIPFALLGLPFLLSFFIAGACTITNLFKNSKLFYLYFAIIWTIFEWLRSWLFTGLPWNLLGYCLSFSTELIQTSSIVGVLGISLIVCYISISPSYLLSKNFKLFNIHLFVSILILGAMFIFGTYRLNNHPTEFTDVSVRLVQPSIPQKQKWDINQFIGSIHKHIELSQADSSITPKIIIWSESALPTLINDPRL
jgi:apolipoprotein N-acyltransferase